MSTTSPVERALELARIDFDPPHRQPSPVAWVVASVVSLVGSLAADAAIVAVGTAVFPSTKGFVHFRFSDYATLTVIGVAIACVAWPVVTRVCSAPRWLFLRLAVLVTLVLWLPDVWILLHGEPAKAVAVLMVMHVAIAVVTYNALVHLAPVRPGRRGQAPAAAGAGGNRAVASEAGADARHADGRRSSAVSARSNRRLSTTLAVLVAVEFVLGVVAIVLVSPSRPTGLVPANGKAIYVLHALVGVPLLVGAVVLWRRSADSPRLVRLAGRVGIVGVALAGLGGLLTIWHPLRLLGIALMFVGPVVAGFAYLLPAMEKLSPPRVEPSRA